MFTVIVRLGVVGGVAALGELWSQMFFELRLLVAAVIPALVMRGSNGGRGTLTLPVRKAFSKLFWVGAIWGFLGITLLLEILHGCTLSTSATLCCTERAWVKFAFFWGAVFLLVGLFEEFLLRGYTQFTLARGIGFWLAAVLLSTAFGASHLKNPGEKLDRRVGCGLNRPLLLSHAAAHRELVVRSGIPCGLGLG